LIAVERGRLIADSSNEVVINIRVENCPTSISANGFAFADGSRAQVRNAEYVVLCQFTHEAARHKVMNAIELAAIEYVAKHKSSWMTK